MDSAKVAYYGVSWGGYLGGLMPAVEPRFKAVVLLVAGLEFQRGLPEVEPINFLPRITMPVLMLNGQYDHYFPVETSQRPMFRLLGTPADKKRQVICGGRPFRAAHGAGQGDARLAGPIPGAGEVTRERSNDDRNHVALLCRYGRQR